MLLQKDTNLSTAVNGAMWCHHLINNSCDRPLKTCNRHKCSCQGCCLGTCPPHNDHTLLSLDLSRCGGKLVTTWSRQAIIIFLLWYFLFSVSFIHFCCWVFLAKRAFLSIIVTWAGIDMCLVFRLCCLGGVLVGVATQWLWTGAHALNHQWLSQQLGKLWKYKKLIETKMRVSTGLWQAILAI